MKLTTKKIALTAVLSALTAALTLVSVPLPGGGYYNFGDVAVFTAALMLGPWTGALVGGLGGALGDLCLGYVMYAPFTLAIKALEALVAGALFKVCKKIFIKESGVLKNTVFSALSNVAGGLVMAVGYFLAEGLLLAESRWQGGMVNLPWNVLQGTVSAIIAAAILFGFRLNLLFEKMIHPSAETSVKELQEKRADEEEKKDAADEEK